MSVILGIESSCDETAAAVVEDQHVRSSVVATQHELHERFGGVVPEIASRAHIERITPVVRAALQEADVSLDDIDAVAVAHRPGLIGSLLVGVSAAKALAWSRNLPLFGIDHVVAHLFAVELDAEAIAYPALGLVVSGGHTNLFLMQDAGTIGLMGRTIDDAAGEAFDKTAAMLALEYPGGPAIERLARLGDAQAVDFPIARLERESLDFSFSGVKTAMLYAVRGTPQGRGAKARFPRTIEDVSEQRKADLAASFQRAVVDAIILKLERAIEGREGDGVTVRSLVVGGGVASNGHLRERLAEVASRHNVALRIAEKQYCVDNAAMIAAAALHRLASGACDDLNLAAAVSGAWAQL
ncbi:MAG: tRNA (adenosine(37)-N6)-threonylcarbamoyltransferase complex transferase subunit TsaD [Phycisphaerales bacterium]